MFSLKARTHAVGVRNPKLKSFKTDHLYHIALDTAHNDLQEMFGDVKCVCFGGQPSRMERFTKLIREEFGLTPSNGEPPRNYAAGTDRYALYKAGPILAVSHGIGIPSLSVVFNEIVKLMYYAKCKDVTFFRIGTCGGVGLEPGTVVVTDKASILGKKVERPALANKELNAEILECVTETDEFKTVTGTTLCCDDFYEGQARLDGAFCDYEEEDKVRFLQFLKEKNICNIEMESLGFLAMCSSCKGAGLRGAVVCAILVDRLQGDYIINDIEKLHQWQARPQQLVLRYIKHKFGPQNGSL
ncbi:hypothetical protein KUTeg_018803 [Tegillarca granosa]|uniref:Nucleoside phosphorylase domain-containing protein n=1 Tax=Tegillarca granosa TaxID=220873 RepID=A0ABQ9EAR9_TEGGR|nr:hypothetical protein KUTeg_018803 [Tegillarca granosa]